MKKTRSSSQSSRLPTVLERVEAELAERPFEAVAEEEAPQDPVQKRIWELERELARLRADPEALKRDSMFKFMASHPQGKVIMLTMMLWYDRHKAEIQERSPSLYKWLMDPGENLAITSNALRAVALHIEALADLQVAKEQSGKEQGT